MKRKTTVLVGVGCSLLASNAYCSGFRLPEISVNGMSSSNAVVADTTTPAAAAYNPASIAFHDNFVELGVIGLRPDITVTPANSAVKVRSRADSWFTLPNFYYVRRLTSDLSFGLGGNSPFGLKTNWPANTFPLPTGGKTTLTQLKMFNITPNIAYRFGDTSVAVGLNYYRLSELAFNTDLMTLTGDGDGYGYNLAALHKVGAFSVGFSYRSAVDANVTGHQTITYPTITTVPAKLTLNLPWTAQIGVNWSVNEQLALEFDIDRTGWSRFDKLKIKNKDSGAALVTSTNDWRDANAYRLGGRYLLDGKTTLRAGYSYDKTCQPDARFTARLADNDRQLYSVGVERDMGGWSLSAGLMHVIFKNRTVSSSAPLGTYGSDPNGTAAYNGRYKASVNLIGLGFSKPL